MNDTAYHSPIDIDAPAMLVLNKHTDHWEPCKPVEDLALTVGTFVLAMAAPVAFFVWMLA